MYLYVRFVNRLCVVVGDSRIERKHISERERRKKERKLVVLRRHGVFN